MQSPSQPQGLTKNRSLKALSSPPSPVSAPVPDDSADLNLNFLDDIDEPYVAFSGHSSAPINLGHGLHVEYQNQQEESMNTTFPLTVKSTTSSSTVNVVNLKDLGMHSLGLPLQKENENVFLPQQQQQLDGTDQNKEFMEFKTLYVQEHDDVSHLAAESSSSSSSSSWDKDSDEFLRSSILKLQSTDSWVTIADMVGSNRTPVECRSRWKTIERLPIKGPWSVEEDALLKRLVAIFGSKKWALSASHFPGRAGKQCRERWLNHLDGSVCKKDWSKEEDDILRKVQSEIGNKWSEIAKLLPGRSENAVKNRFNSLLSRKSSAQRSRQTSATLTTTSPPKPSQPKTLLKNHSSSSTISLESIENPQPPKSGKPRQRPRSNSSKSRITVAATSGADNKVPAEGGELVDTIFSTLGKDIPTTVVPDLDSPPKSSGLNLDLKFDPVSDNEDSVEMTCMKMTKKVLDVEVEREKLFSNVILSQRDWKNLGDAKSQNAPQVGVVKRSRRKRTSTKKHGWEDDDFEDEVEDVEISMTSANAAFEKFRRENPSMVDSDLLISYGDMSLGETASANLAISPPDGQVLEDFEASALSVEISFNSLSMQDASLEVLAANPNLSPRAPSLKWGGSSSANVSPRAPSRGANPNNSSAARNSLKLESIGSANSDLLSFSIDAPLGLSDMSLDKLKEKDDGENSWDVGKKAEEEKAEVVKEEVAEEKKVEEKDEREEAAEKKTQENPTSLTNLEKILKPSDLEESSTFATPTPPPSFEIKGRLGATRRKKQQSTTASKVAPVAQTFGDATIEAAIAAAINSSTTTAAAVKPAPLQVAEYPGLSIFPPQTEEEEGDTQRIECSKNNKRSRPSTRDSLGSLGRLSCATSVADLSIEKMSLTNSVKSLSLEDDDWNLLAQISQKMGNNDNVTSNLHPNMQMSDLMKVGWELRPKALEGTNGSEHHSRGSSAGSRGSLTSGLGLGVSGIIKVNKSDVKELHKQTLIEASVLLDNLPTRPVERVKPAKPSRSSHSHRKVSRQRVASPTKRVKKDPHPPSRSHVIVQPSTFSFDSGFENTAGRGGERVGGRAGRRLKGGGGRSLLPY
ncbi:hypothetical protein TrST_g1880 [Triparma strigata]|nr:hypothetical protein TrST_g1880 [Triparma strigata]